MLYEWRVYDVIPGKLAQIHARFANKTLPLWEKHGIRVVGFWENAIGGPSNQIIYMLGWESYEEREAKFGAFGRDPEWIQAKADSEKDGLLVSRTVNSILKPTPYSPMK